MRLDLIKVGQEIDLEEMKHIVKLCGFYPFYSIDT